jgi:hypothetical protein
MEHRRGADSGDKRSHRGMRIIDRSIFEGGSECEGFI